MQTLKLSLMLAASLLAACGVSQDGGDEAALGSSTEATASAAVSVAPLSCAPPSLTPGSTTSLQPARTTFNANARNGYTWCRLGTLSRYSEPLCPQKPVTLQQVVDELVELDGDLRGWTFADGQVLTAAQIAAIEPFTTSCSSGGPGFYAAVRANVSTSTPQGWLIESEVPCHNCHEFGRFYVLYYPSNGQVLVIPYITGYDS